MNPTVIALALCANLCFATGSQFFTHFSRKIGSVWMNWFKASIALVGFTLWVILSGELHWIGLSSMGPLMFSGIIGLGIGDILLLASFKQLGPGRTLMLFSFQPLITGVASYFLFNQTIDSERFFAILFFILCVFIFSIESFKNNKHWALGGIALAVGGMILDATGVVITRSVFDNTPGLTPMLSNFYRTSGAVVFFIIFGHLKKVSLIDPFQELQTKEKAGAIVGSFLGTFLSLGLYLTALQYAHIASLTGISITSAIFSSLLECLWSKKWPSRYLIAAFCSFLIGMWILLF